MGIVLLLIISVVMVAFPDALLCRKPEVVRGSCRKAMCWLPEESALLALSKFMPPEKQAAWNKCGKNRWRQTIAV